MNEADDFKRHEGTPKRKKSPFFFLAIVVGALVLVAGLYMLIHAGEVSTDDASLEAHVVTLSPKVAGYVKTLAISDNQLVKAGDVLMEIDPVDYELKRDRAAAVLQAAEAGVNAAHQNVESTNVSAPSNLQSAQAQVKAAKAAWDKSLIDLNRMKRLSNEARSREELDTAVANEKTARSNLEDAQAKLRSAETAPKTIAAAEANRAQLQAQVKQAEAELAQAEKDLADTKIVAPADGRITRRAVEQGDYVQPGEQLGALVGTDFWVVANFKETQLKHMKPGQPVRIKIDAFPNVKVEGKVDSFMSGTGGRFSAFPAENATGNFVKIVQRVPVKITLTTPLKDIPVGPGMSVVPVVETK
jgi:membrane fusion protein (multidrug efflux system)